MNESMSLPEMLSRVETLVSDRPGMTAAIQNETSGHPRVELDQGGSIISVQLEVGYEMFFLHTSDGFLHVSSELWREDQEELLSDLVAVAGLYMKKKYLNSRRRYLFKTKIKRVVRLNGYDYVFKLKN